MKEYSKYKLSGYSVFFLLGMLLTALPALMPVIKEELRLSYDSLGFIFSSGSVGFFIGSFFAGFSIEKFGAKKNNLTGLFLTLAGVIGVIFSENALALSTSNFIYSFGTALLEIGVPSIAKKFVSKTGGVMNLMHSLFALGAVFSPVVVSLLISSGISWKVFYIIIAVSTAIPALLFSSSGTDFHSLKTQKDINGSFGFLKLPIFWMVCATVLCYVFSELGVNSWASTFATDHMKFSPGNSSLLPSVFWAGLFVGRLFSSKFVDRTGQIKWLMLISAVGLPVVFFAQKPIQNYLFMLVFVFLSGTVHASFYPTLQSIIMDRVKNGVGFAISVFSAIGSLGGVFGGLFIGRISDIYGISTGYFSAFFFFAMTFVLVYVIYYLFKFRKE